MIVKHSKYKNTGILFELLVRQITSDTLSGVDSKAATILKKHFVKTELGKEYKLYETLLNNIKLSEGKADIIINTLLESAKYLNKSALRRQKYNLIKEIKANYDVDEFFKTKLPNYKTQAAFYTLLEMYDGVNQPEANQVISNKLILLEHLTSAPITTVAKDTLMEEFKSYDKDIRMLTYRALLEKFNSKYANLNEGQKSVLKEFINSVDNPSKLKDFYNTKITEIKSDLTKLNKKVKDKTTQIKINEVSNILVTLDKNDKISNDDMTNLLHYYELLEELRKVNG
jgi:tyrosine-protein phosphatase YwqE